MSALKSLPAVEQVGWYVRTARTMGDLAGVIVANSGSPEADHYVFAPEHGNLVAALTAEAINTARETGIGPAEMRRQRDELLTALKAVLASGLNGGNNVRLAFMAASRNVLSASALAQADDSERAVREAEAAIATAEGAR